MPLSYNPFTLAKKMNRPLILDGAIGSLLQSRGVPRDEHLWMCLANITHPDSVIELHREYINAGADIITTNTFRTNPTANKGYSSSANKMDIKLDSFISKSVDLALTAAAGTAALIAGSNPPAEDCYQKDTHLTIDDYFWNHETHIKKLFDSNCHFILNETHSHLNEIETVSSICNREKIPFVVSLFFDEDFNLLSGQPVEKAIDVVLKNDPLAISFNCIKPETFLSFIKKREFEFDWGVYLNCGSGELRDDINSSGISPDEYKEIIREVLKYNPSFIGGCCGTSPEHIKKIKELIDERIED
jgi:methionine synthase I (cobalamin-dependent)